MEKILKQVLNIKETDSKTNIILDFELEKDYNQLVFHLCYSPKEVDNTQIAKSQIEEAIKRFIPNNAQNGNVCWQDFVPLCNLITLSLDYQNQYLGCAHRQAPSQTHYINQSSPSYGFITHQPVKGHYRAVLNVHAVIGDDVTYQIEIEAE